MKLRDRTGENSSNIFGGNSRLLHQSRTFGSDSSYTINHWSELASCLGKSDTFTLMSHEVGKEKGLTLLDVWRINVSKVRVAKSICVTCPVRSECLDASTPADRMDSVWGGTTPTGLQSAAPINRSLGSRIETDPNAPCVNGHVGSWAQHKGAANRLKWVCLLCSREKQERARRKAAEQEGRELRLSNKAQTHCVRGHLLPEKNERGKRPCLPCRRITSVEYRKVRAARAKLEA